MIAPLLVVLALAGAPSVTPPAALPANVWYGSPAVIADAATVGGVALWLIADETGHHTLGATMAFASLGGLLLGAPINHFVDGHPARAIASLGLRAGAAALGVTAFVYTLTKDNCIGETPENCSSALLLTVLLAPAGIAMIVDDALIARAPPSPSANAGARVAGPTPWFDGRGARGLSLVARF